MQIGIMAARFSRPTLEGVLDAGTGLLDYDHYLSLLRHAGCDGGLVLHGLAENQVETCVEFLRSKLSPA